MRRHYLDSFTRKVVEDYKDLILLEYLPWSLLKEKVDYICFRICFLFSLYFLLWPCNFFKCFISYQLWLLCNSLVDIRTMIPNSWRTVWAFMWIEIETESAMSHMVLNSIQNLILFRMFKLHIPQIWNNFTSLLEKKSKADNVILFSSNINNTHANCKIYLSFVDSSI